MADYSGAYERTTPEERRIAELSAELARYKAKERDEELKNTNFLKPLSRTDEYVDCGECGAKVRNDLRSEHRKRCV